MNKKINQPDIKRNVVITGASRGLGKAFAEKFASNGYNLYLCSRNEVSLYKAMEDLQTRFPLIAIKAKAFDLAVKSEAQAFGKWVLSQGFTIDVLVNNAGSFTQGDILQEEEGALEKMMDVNLYSAYYLTQTLLPKMIQQDLSSGSRGHIFNICSIASLQAYANGSAYGISKFALAGFSKNLREIMKPYHIKVSTVYPGAVYTDSWIGSGVSEKRIMEARDIADMVFAASQLSPQATVEDIIIRPQLGDL